MGDERDGRGLVREVFALAWPALLQAFMQTVVFFCDRLMLGRHSKVEIASLVVAGVLIWSITMVFGVWTHGTLAVVARDKGAGREEELPRHVATSIALALAIGAAVAAAGIALARPLVGLYDVPPDVARAGESYLVILLAALPLVFVGLTLMSVFAAVGDTLTPMLVSAVAHSLNVLGNYALIFGRFGFPELGIHGAALASALAFCVFALLLLAALLRRRSPVPMRPRDLLRLSRASLRRIVRVSVPAAGERVIFHLGYLVHSRIVTCLGTLAMAAQEGLIALQSVVFLPGDGFAIAAGSIMGRYLGARRPDEARQGTRIATWMAATPLVGAGLVFALAPGALIGLFTTDPKVVAIGTPALLVGAFEGLFLGAFQVVSGALRGAGDTRTPMVVTAFGIWCVRLPVCALLALPPAYTFGLGLGLGLLGIWLGTLLDWFLRAALVVWAFERGRWRSLRV